LFVPLRSTHYSLTVILGGAPSKGFAPYCFKWCQLALIYQVVLVQFLLPPFGWVRKKAPPKQV